MVSKMKTHNGGEGGVVVCLGVGGLVDLSGILQLDDEIEGGNPAGGVEVWLIDARRPWNLGNVFAGDPKIVPGVTDEDQNLYKAQVDRGEIQRVYKPGAGGIIVYDDGDIVADLEGEREAYCALLEMGDIEEESDDGESDVEEDRNIMMSIEDEQPNGRKRKAGSDEEQDSDEEDQRPRQRRRSNSVSACTSLAQDLLMIYSRVPHSHPTDKDR